LSEAAVEAAPWHRVMLARLSEALSRGAGTSRSARDIESGRQDMTAQEDIASVAGQLATLTHTVEEMATQLKAMREQADSQQKRADTQQERTETQQERIDLAARELAEVSDRLQAAATALRASI
jgi:molecular chaperone GrpE (heat shock protein)